MAQLYIPGFTDYNEAAAYRQANEEHAMRQSLGGLKLQGLLQEMQAQSANRKAMEEFAAQLPPAEQLKFRVDPAGYLKSIRPNPQQKAATALAGLLSTGGYQPPEGASPTDGAAVPATSVATSDADALARLGAKMNPDGTITMVSDAPPQAVNVPNQANVRALSVMAEPEKAIPEILRQQRPVATKPAQDYTPVTGGYLERQPDGTAKFVRTAPEAAPRAEPAPSFIVTQDPKSPTGWSHKNTRTGELSPGAPPPASATPKPPRPIPAPLQKQLTEAAELVDATERFVTTFKENYGGKTFTGDLGNQWGRVFGDDTGQAQWWQDYELHQSQIRNKLFGSALTTAEIEAWNKSAINPRMNSGEIRKNLVRRETIERKGYGKLTNFAEKSGFPREQIEALTGRPMGGAVANQPDSPRSVLDQADAILRGGANGNR